MAVQIQLRRDFAATWTSVNPTLALGEIGVERDTGRVKIGNGVDEWEALGYGTVVDGTGPFDGAFLQSYVEAVLDLGVNDGTVVIDVSAAPLQVLELSGATTLEFTGFPSSGVASVTVEVDLNGNTLSFDPDVEWPDGDPPELDEGYAKLVFDGRPGRATHGQLVGSEYA